MNILLIYTRIFAFIPIALFIDTGFTGNKIIAQIIFLVHQFICLIIMITITIKGL